MAKRKNDSKGSSHKRFKAGGFIDPSTSGIYATCNRGREVRCKNELMDLLGDYIKEEENQPEANEKDSSIEDEVLKEINELKASRSPVKDILKPIDLNCECLVFIKTKKPIEPETLVETICRSISDNRRKSTRYTQRLTPITFSVSASLEEVKKLAQIVLKPHFHATNQQPFKFAIQLSKRNFNILRKQDIIKTIAECVGKENGHQVDLKTYDKLILVECYKNNIGMSVVNDYLTLEKFNLQQLFDKASEKETQMTSRVNQSEYSDNFIQN